MNPKIEQIEAAETAIDAFKAEHETMRDSALQDGIIDAEEQADLDRLAAKIDRLQNVVRTLRATVEQNRRIWDAQGAELAEWTEQLAALRAADRTDLGAFDAARTEMTDAVADQRWADASRILTATRAAMAPVYAEFMAEAPALVGAGGGVGAAPAVDPAQGQWTSVQAAFARAMTALERHVKAGHASIAPDIAATKASAAAAVTQANGGDLAGAVAAMTPLIAACAAIEDKAHDVAHYDEIKGHRQSLVAHPSSAPVGVAAIDDLQTEMAALLAGAQADATAGKFADAVAKLDLIPPIFDRKQGLNVMQGDYTWRLNACNNSIATIDGVSDADRAPVLEQINRYKSELADALIAKTKDYSVSVPLLSVLQRELAGLATAVRSSSTYTAALNGFNAELGVLEPHAGHVAVEEFYQSRVIDRDQAVADAEATRFPAAIALLRRTKPADWTAQKAIAGAYVIYLANRQAAQAVVDAVRAMPGTADLIPQADALMTTAAEQAQAKDIAAAEQSLVEAQVRANDAKTASEAQAALVALRDDAALDGVATDFAAALAVFTSMKAHVVAQDATGTFTAAIAQADSPIATAQTEAAKAAPDMVAVRTNLDAGIAVLEAVLPKILAHALFQAHLATVTTTVYTTLPGLSAANDGCIDPAIDACKVLVTEAEDLAKDPTFDFVAAEAKLAGATEKARTAQANVTLYAAKIGPAKIAMTAALASITAAGANIARWMAASVTRLNDIMSDITVAVAAEDFALANAMATEGTAVAGIVAQDIGLCQTIDADYTRFVTNAIGRVQGGEPEVADALARANAKIAEFNDSIASGAFRLSRRLISEINWAIFDGVRALQASGPYKTAKTAARSKLDVVVALRCPGVEDRLTALEARYAAAVTLGDQPQYITATTKMDEIAAEADTLLPVAQAFTAYEAARTAAGVRLTEAEGHAQLAAIQTTVTRLRAKYVSAEQLAAGGDPARAQTQMEEIQTGAETAIADADNVSIFDGIVDAIGGSASDTGGPTFVHIAAARRAYDWQADKANAHVASAELAEANTKLGLADNNATPPADQTIALRSAMDLITQAAQIISQHTLLIQELATARVRLALLRANPQAGYLVTQLAAMETAINGIEAGATDLASLPGCSSELETVMADVLDYQTKMAAQGEYVSLRASPEVEPRLIALEGHDHSYAIQTNIEAMRSKLADAARLSETFDPVAAVTLLKEVRDIGLSATVLADMRDNVAPTAAQLSEILARPDGQAELDAMVDALEPDAQRAVLEAAFEARFGCDLQNLGSTNPGGNQPGPNIRRFYELMSDLPTTDTLDNDSLRVFQDIENARGSDYTGGGTKRVAMREGDAVLSRSYNFGAEYQVGAVEDGCEPVDNEPVNYFSWNTLHEVGHAVDDQHSFMDRRQGGADYGGWKVYGGNTDPIATVAAAHFKYDKTYIKQAMAQRLEIRNAAGAVTTSADADPALPQPQGCSPEEWEGRRIAFVSWLGRIREPRSPWASQSTAQQIAIDGVVYQESYTQNWTSYQLAARSRGITAYQFRAPAEWFSELYAAYHSGKLKDNHPSAGWLSDLTSPA